MADEQTTNPRDIAFTLNGREVRGAKGETIIEVAQREGVYVPHYCWHPSLTVAGNCRLCLVEMHMPNAKEPGKLIPGPKPVIACQTTIAAGSAVMTASPLAESSQSGMMEFLLANHPLDCPICDRGGECMLQRYSMEFGSGHSRVEDKKRKFHKPQADPLIDIERNRCIICTRCVRFCDEVGGEHVMGVFDRGEGNYIGTFGQGPVSSILSGNVIDLCPVGCLTSRPFRFKARAWELEQVQSTCVHCSSGCKVTHWIRNGKLFRTTPPSRKRHDHFTVNEDSEEFICNQGRFASDFAQGAGRRDESRMRIGEGQLTAPFAEAVRTAAALLKPFVGTGAAFVALSPRTSIEGGHAAAKFARTALATENLDWRGSFASRDAADAVSLALANGDGDLAAEPDVVVVLNGDLAHQSPILAQRLQALARMQRKTLVLIGHHHDSYLAPHTSLRLHVAPGKTGEALAALSEAVASEAAVAGLAGILGIPAERAQHVAATLKGAKRGLLVHPLDECRGAFAPSEVAPAVALRTALGDAWGYLPVVRDRNAVGLSAVGASARPGSAGLSLAELLPAIESRQVRALVLVGADALDGIADRRRLLSALAQIDCFIACDAFETEVTRLAHVVLATTGNLEETGVFADIEGNLALLQAGIPASGASRPAWACLSAIATQLGSKAFSYGSAADVWSEARAAIAPASRATHETLALAGPSRPGLTEDPGGARRRTIDYNPGDYRTDGAHLRAKARTAGTAGAAPAIPSGDGLILLWGGHVSGKGDSVNAQASICQTLQPRPFVEVNPRDAETLSLRDDQFAVLTAGETRVKVGVRVSKGPAPGCAYLPSGTAGAFDAATLPGPVRIKLEGLDEMVPDQGAALAGSTT